MSINYTYNKGLVSRIYSFQNNNLKNLIKNFKQNTWKAIQQSIYTYGKHAHDKMHKLISNRKMQIKTTIPILLHSYQNG